MTTSPATHPWLIRLGIPPALAWGYLAVLLFMIGDGVESNYLAPYLHENGFSLNIAAWVIAFLRRHRHAGLMAGRFAVNADRPA